VTYSSRPEPGLPPPPPPPSHRPFSSWFALSSPCSSWHSCRASRPKFVAESVVLAHVLFQRTKVTRQARSERQKLTLSMVALVCNRTRAASIVKCILACALIIEGCEWWDTYCLLYGNGWLKGKGRIASEKFLYLDLWSSLLPLFPLIIFISALGHSECV